MMADDARAPGQNYARGCEKGEMEQCGERKKLGVGIRLEGQGRPKQKHGTDNI